MAYHTSGGIFAGLDDTDPVLHGYRGQRHARRSLRGLDDARGVYSLQGLDDQRGVYSLRQALRGLDDARGVYSLRQPLRGLGETPPGTTDRDKNDIRKNFYYLYCAAAMAPVFRKQAGIATGVGVAGIVAALATGGLGLILTGGAAAAGAIMAAGTENCIMETTLWWKRSKKDRDNYIKGAMVGEDVKSVLRSAAKRLDKATEGIKDPLRRQRARARAYFQDFIAVGKQAGLKSLTPDQQGAFGYEYLRVLGQGKKEEVALAKGTEAANRVRQQAEKAAFMQSLKQKKAQLQAQRRAAAEAAKKAAQQAMEKRAKAKAAKDKLRAARDAVEAARLQREAAAAETEAAKAESDAKQAEQTATVVAAEEQKADQAEKAAEKQADALQPPPEEKKEAAQQDSDEEKADDKAADVADKAAGTSTTADATAPEATKSKGGGGLLPVVAAAGALALGAPALPVVGAAAALAFLMRKK